MAITLLFGCCQIETTARNLDEVRRFMRDAFSAGPIEQVLAAQIDDVMPDTDYACDHIGLGEAVFQVNQPDPKMLFNGHPSIHQAYLDRVGPSVTTHFCVETNDMARDYKYLKACGVDFTGRDWLEEADVKAAYGYDPEGNIIEIQQCSSDSPQRLGLLQACPE